MPYARKLGREEAREIGPLNQKFSIAIRMVVVLVFLLGMPFAAVPRVSEYLRGMLVTKAYARAVHHKPLGAPSNRTEGANASAELTTTVTVLASDPPPPPLATRDPDTMAASIEALKAQFVEAGVSYMVLAQIGSDSPKYRFQFELPVAPGSAYRKRFQVVDDAPDGAMRQALSELHQWRVAEREPAHLERPTVILR